MRRHRYLAVRCVCVLDEKSRRVETLVRQTTSNVVLISKRFFERQRNYAWERTGGEKKTKKQLKQNDKIQQNVDNKPQTLGTVSPGSPDLRCVPFPEEEIREHGM